MSFFSATFGRSVAVACGTFLLLVFVMRRLFGEAERYASKLEMW